VSNLKCYHCGIQGVELFKCEECGQNYCSRHINPTNHECNLVKEYHSSNINSQQNAYTSQSYSDVYQGEVSAFDTRDDGEPIRGTTDGSFKWYREERYIPEDAFSPDSGIEFKGILFPFKSELLHLIIGASLIFIIGLITFYNPQLIQYNLTWAIFMLAGFYTTAFLFHEFGHRQVAIHFGLQTKFRLLTYGMILTAIGLVTGLISLFSNSLSLPSIAVPGAVVVLGLEKIDRTTGLCKIAGPAINLVYGIILLIISFFIAKSLYPLNMFVGIAAALNFTLGIFNMLPIGILDGKAIFKWNKGAYLLLFLSLLGLVIYTYLNIYVIEFSWYIP
jgi:Zn-dependent protease